MMKQDHQSFINLSHVIVIEEVKDRSQSVAVVIVFFVGSKAFQTLPTFVVLLLFHTGKALKLVGSRFQAFTAVHIFPHF